MTRTVTFGSEATRTAGHNPDPVGVLASITTNCWIADDERQPPDPCSRWGQRNKKTRASHLVRILVSAVLVGVIFLYLDVGEFLSAVRNVSPGYLLLVILMVVIDRLIVVHKWNLLLISRGVHVAFYQLFSMYTTAQLASFVLPSTVGGDLFRVYRLRDYGVSVRLSIASIMVERVIGFLSMLVIATVALGASFYMLTTRSTQLVSVAWALGLAILCCLGIFSAIKHEGLNKKLASLASDAGNWRFLGKLHDVYNQCREYRKDTEILVKVTTYTFIRQLLPIVINVLLAIAFSIDASLLEIIVIVPLIVLGSRLPISMDGIGVQEGLYVVLFNLVGVSASEALLMSLAFRGMVLVTLIPFAFLYLISGKKNHETRFGRLIEIVDGNRSTSFDRNMNTEHLNKLDKSNFIRHKLFDEETSSWKRYAILVVGEPSLWKLAKYELITFFLGPVPGAVGLALRKVFYPSLFRQSGAGVVFGRSLVIRNADKITLGDGVVIDDYTLLDARGSGEEGILIGDKVIINPGSNANFQSWPHFDRCWI